MLIKDNFLAKLLKESILKPIAAFKSGMKEVDTRNNLDEFLGPTSQATP